MISVAGSNPQVNQIVAGNAGITGDIITPSRLLSRVTSHGAVSGLILAEGNIGVQTPSRSGSPLLLGGLVAYGPISGQVVTQGQLVGNITAYGGMTSGLIVAEGGIPGNITIDSRFTPGSAIISGGEIGDATLGTSLAMPVSGLRGFVAAMGSIRYAPNTNQPTSESFHNLAAGSPNALAIDALFAQINQDVTGADDTELATDVYRLKDSNGTLVYS